MTGQGPRPATAMDPGAALNHAALALGEGRLDDAEKLCRGILASDPQSAVALQLLGLIAHRQTHYTDAIGFLRRSIAIDPDQAIWHFNLGVSYRAAGSLQEAGRAYAQAVKIDTSYAPAHYNLGSVFLESGNTQQALACFKATLKHQPNHGNACFKAGTLYRDAGDVGRALAMLRRASRLLPDDLQVRLALGVVLIDSGELDEARDLLESLLRVQPDLAEAATGLAGVYERLGEHDRAWELIEPLLEHKRVGGDAALVLADFAPKLGHEALAIQTLNEALNKSGDSDDRQMLCHFALGRLHDRKGEADRAFDHFQQANTLKPRRFDPTEHEHHIDEIIRTFSADALTNNPRATHRDNRPIFIVGMPRSGTSLVEQILATHEDIVGGGELPTISSLAGQLRRMAGSGGDLNTYPTSITQAQLNEMARVYLAQLDKIDTDTHHITDKAPSNFLYLGLIAMMIPGTRIVHCKRDPMATCWSCFTTNFVGEHAYSYNLEHLGLYYQQYQRLMQHWRDVLDIPMLEVEYEQLVTDPEPAMRELVAFCGLPWSDACLRFHENPRRMPSASYDQVRRPIYTSSIDRWRRYEPHLAPLREALDRPAA